LFARPVTDAPPDNVLFHLKGTVLDIALQAAKQRPAWTFYVTKNGSSDMSVKATIYCGEERLGTLIMEHYYPREGRGGDYRPCIACPGLARQMTRKNSMSSANPKRILKAILDYCRETPVHELVAAKMVAAQRGMQSAVYNQLVYTVDKDLDPNVVYGFLDERGLWEEFASRAVAAGATPDFANQIKTKVLAKRAADSLHAAATAGNLYLAIPKDQDYYVTPVNSILQNVRVCGPVTLYTQDHHTNEFKTAIGVLKLALEGTLVDGIGTKRVVEDTPQYFVVLKGGVQG
jgi:hypothetical protein